MSKQPGYSFRKFVLQNSDERQSCTHLIFLFVFLKIVINAFAVGKFGFQRDELLYITLGDHLDWGFKEVPPFIALLAKTSTSLFGNSLSAYRMFSTIFSALLVWFTGKTVVEFGGKKFAVTLACLAVIFSPAFAASGYLFEPVVFDQLWWVLFVYLLVKYCNTLDKRYLYFNGLVTGMGLLTKYSIMFFVIAVIIGLLATKKRRAFWNWHVLMAILIAFILFLPNLLWQINHHFPFITQMTELRTEQLVNITYSDFFTQQLIFNGIVLFVWLIGLGFLLTSPGFLKFRFLGFAYLLVFLFLMLLHGKNYYMLGAYPMLFAAGSVGIEKCMSKKSNFMRAQLALFLTLPNLLLLPLFLPVFSLHQTIVIFNSAYKNFPFFAFEAKWDDQQLHPIPQNYGVMFGWDEMAEKVSFAYKGLTEEQKKHTMIYAINYGQASSLHYYRKQYHLPEVVSLNSSFSLWAPSKLDADYIILIDDKSGKNIKKLQPQIESYRKLSEVKNPLAVEKGTSVFLLIHPKQAFKKNYRKQWAQTKLK